MGGQSRQANPKSRKMEPRTDYGKGRRRPTHLRPRISELRVTDYGVTVTARRQNCGDPAGRV